MTEFTKLCIDCRHHTSTDYCKLTGRTDPVDGHQVYQTCASQRRDDSGAEDACGFNGFLFQPREAPSR